MTGRYRRLVCAVRRERGAAVAQLGILLGAPVVAASVFGAAAMSAGTDASNQLQRTVMSAIQDSSSGIQLRGPVLALTDGRSITHVLIDATTIPGGQPVDLDPAAATGRTVVTYVDAGTIAHDLPYTVTWIGGDNGDRALDADELAEIDVDVRALEPDTDFTLEIRPAHGAWITLHITRPPGTPLNHVIQLG